MDDMDKKIALGLGLTLAIVIFVFVYGLNEPNRMAAASEEFRLGAVGRGEELYAAYCASCHGDSGQGVSKVAPPLNSKSFLEATDDAAIREAISYGRRPQMSPFSEARGGPLRSSQIEDLVAFIRNWQPTAPLLTPTPTPELALGDTERGALIYAQSCAMCHGKSGEGKVAKIQLNAEEYLSTHDDAAIFKRIAEGITGKMPPFAEANGGPLTEAGIWGLVAFIRSWQK